MTTEAATVSTTASPVMNPTVDSSCELQHIRLLDSTRPKNSFCSLFIYSFIYFIYLLASERSERDTLWSVQLRIADIYIIIIYILWYVQNFCSYNP